MDPEELRLWSRASQEKEQQQHDPLENKKHRTMKLWKLKYKVNMKYEGEQREATPEESIYLSGIGGHGLSPLRISIHQKVNLSVCRMN